MLSRDGGLVKLPPPARVTDQHLADMIERVIVPTACAGATDLLTAVNAEITEWRTAEPGIFNTLIGLAAQQLPQAEAIVLLTDDTPQFFGYNGEYTKVLEKTHAKTKQFWDIPSDDIQLIGMHGSMLVDEARVAATYQAAFTSGGQPIPAALAALLASIVADAVQQSQFLDGGDFAAFSFNAFAVSDPSGVIPDKIVMGDGIMAGYEALGFGDVAPQAIYAHEFAHHIQFENGYQTEPIPGSTPPITPAERTRYLELMSDATAAYFLTHKRGSAMNKHRVAEFLQAFFEIGDCSFTNPGHHGTPAQRMRAAEFGFSVADQAQKQGHILSSDAFHDLFVAEFPDLVAP
ncbi:MAG: hypothetical protein ACREM9_01630 [Gemmatimonadales bacterium]